MTDDERRERNDGSRRGAPRPARPPDPVGGEGPNERQDRRSRPEERDDKGDSLTSPPGLRGQKQRPPGGPVRPRRGGEGKAPPRPTPVRVSMDVGGDEEPSLDELESRTLRCQGREWIVRVTGWATTGGRPALPVPLMQLEFYRADDPTTPLRRAMTLKRPLDELPEDELDSILECASQVTEAEADDEPAPRRQRFRRSGK